MKFAVNHQSALHDILSWRRDVRHFRTDPIDSAVLSKIEASVDLAPSVGNSRPWRFVRVASELARAKVIASFEASNAQASEDFEDEAKNAYLALKLSGMREAPVHLAVYTARDPKAGRGLGRKTMPQMLQYSTVTAIYTLWLTARAHNVGVGWVSILDPAEVDAALGVPDDWMLSAYLCLGYPAFDSETPELVETGWQESEPTVWLDC
ncbi:5,6-dimethylbenzimidazole synthase [Algirhabdus cladophorae]|uniref:5,6-dimethylbenzimidazole synthase n=1 Tax=Algirhabdus cladophorae TaxID=3377108 RepID=UPI003B84B397